MAGPFANSHFPPRHLLVADDFSAASERALPYAEAMALQFHARLTLFHANAWAEGMDEFEHGTECIIADARLRDRASECFLEGIATDTLIKAGPFAEQVVSAMLGGDFDFVVMGTTAPCGLERNLLGSSAEDLFVQSTVPTMVVGPQAKRLSDRRWRPSSITEVIISGEQNCYAHDYARSAAQLWGARLGSADVIALKKDGSDHVEISPGSEIDGSDLLIIPISTKHHTVWCVEAVQHLVRSATCPVIAVSCADSEDADWRGGTWTW